MPPHCEQVSQRFAPHLIRLTFVRHLPLKRESIVETDFSNKEIGKGESRKDMKEQAL